MNISEDQEQTDSVLAADETRPPEPKRISAGAAVQAGALVSAVVASACCWLPLVLIAFGVSGGALSASFEAWRPVFLPLTFVLLAIAFYLTYRTPKAVAAGAPFATGESCSLDDEQAEACCPPESKTVFTIKKFNKVILWLVTVVVLAFALFPNYVGTVLGGNADTLAGWQDLDKLAVRLEGMTCEACGVTIAETLRAVPGVTAAEVSYERAVALIGIPKGSTAPRSEILAAISRAGYSGRFADQNHWELAIEGMTCAGCVSMLEGSLFKVPGVQAVSVSYENGSAAISSSSTLNEEQFRKAVQEAGFSLVSAKQKQPGSP